MTHKTWIGMTTEAQRLPADLVREANAAEPLPADCDDLTYDRGTGAVEYTLSLLALTLLALCNRLDAANAAAGVDEE